MQLVATMRPLQGRGYHGLLYGMYERSRIELSELTSEHLEQIMGYSHDPLLKQMMGWEAFDPHDPKDLSRCLDRLATVSVPNLGSGKSITRSIICKDSKSFIGYASLKGIDSPPIRAELAIAILAKESRGKGYGTEALRAIISYGFESLGLECIYLTVFTYNTKAIALYERLGFRTIDLLKESWELSDGSLADMLVMELTPGRYEAYQGYSCTNQGKDIFRDSSQR